MRKVLDIPEGISWLGRPELGRALDQLCAEPIA
jgi:hypothetical protein